PPGGFRVVGRLIAVEKARAGKRAVGNELDVAAGRDVLEAAEIGKLPGETGLAAGDSRPERVFAVDGIAAHEGDAPRLRTGRRRESQALERDRNPHDISKIGEHAARLPNRVEAEVVVLPVGHDAVELDAE